MLPVLIKLSGPVSLVLLAFQLLLRKGCHYPSHHVQGIEKDKLMAAAPSVSFFRKSKVFLPEHIYRYFAPIGPNHITWPLPASKDANKVNK